MIEVADIFREHGSRYRSKVKMPVHVHKAMASIENCRTSNLGGHVEKCDECGVIRISYNSCRNRHCPKCQHHAKELWLEDRLKDLLPIQYYHVVFTFPEELNELCLYNKEKLYSILFKASAETLKELSKDNKYIGAEIGFTSILHTWGQNLTYHPHIHSVVTGGGLSEDGSRWIHGKKDFFIPVRVLSKVFRGKFLYFLRREFYKNKLVLKKSTQEFYTLLEEIKQKEWVVYCKKPFKSAGRVMAYLGRYTHRIAISNHRIKKLENGNVTFEYKDYRDKNRKKYMTISAVEFIRRFLLHILPHRFMKIRHYGLMSNRNRNAKLKKAKKILGVKLNEGVMSKSKAERIEKYQKCPYCRRGAMVRKYELKARSSPLPIISKMVL